MVAAVVLVVTCAASLAIGTENVALPTVWQALTDYQDIGDQWIVHDLRIPRTVLALLVGLALGLAGTLIQAVGRNPLADTEILGINSGAALFVVSAIAFLGVHDVWNYIWFAFGGSLFAMLMVYLVGMTGRTAATPVRVLLAGVAVAAVLDGIGFAVRLRYPRAFDNMRFWDAGALDARGLDISTAIAPFIVVGAILCVVVGRPLNVTALGDDLAKSMGGNVVRTQVLSLVAVTLPAGAATAGAGPIGFVGLMVPHAVGRFTGPDWRWLLAYSVVVPQAHRHTRCRAPARHRGGHAVHKTGRRTVRRSTSAGLGGHGARRPDPADPAGRTDHLPRQRPPGGTARSVHGTEPRARPYRGGGAAAGCPAVGVLDWRRPPPDAHVRAVSSPPDPATTPRRVASTSPGHHSLQTP